MFLLGFCVFNAVNDAINFHWHLLHSSLSGGNKFLGYYTGKKNCVREMAMEVGYPLVVLGATWGVLEFIHTIEMWQLFSFLLSMLLASPVVGYIASGLVVTI